MSSTRAWKILTHDPHRTSLFIFTFTQQHHHKNEHLVETPAVLVVDDAYVTRVALLSTSDVFRQTVEFGETQTVEERKREPTEKRRHESFDVTVEYTRYNRTHSPGEYR